MVTMTPTRSISKFRAYGCHVDDKPTAFGIQYVARFDFGIAAARGALIAALPQYHARMS